MGNLNNMAEQNERAFQKQEASFLNSKSVLAAKTKKGVRYYKNVGLGYKTPKEAIEGTYVDKKCPFTSSVNIRGRILKGMCISANKMKNTIVVRRDYYIMSRNTTDSKRDIETSQSIVHQLSESRKEILLPSDNADLYLRLSDSTP